MGWPSALNSALGLTTTLRSSINQGSGRTAGILMDLTTGNYGVVVPPVFGGQMQLFDLDCLVCCLVSLAADNSVTLGS